MGDSNFVGALTEDIELLSSDDAPTPAESDVSEPSSFNDTESIDTDDGEAIQKQAEENKPHDADKSALNNSRPIPTPQNYELPNEQERAAVDSGLKEFWREEIAAALPQWMDARDRDRNSAKVNAGILQEIYKDKAFMASLEKSFDGSRQSLQRGAELLLEKWLIALPRQIRKLNLPKPLSQAESNRMNVIDVLSSMRPVERRGKWIPWESELAEA